MKKSDRTNVHIEHIGEQVLYFDYAFLALFWGIYQNNYVRVNQKKNKTMFRLILNNIITYATYDNTLCRNMYKT